MHGWTVLEAIPVHCRHCSSGSVI